MTKKTHMASGIALTTALIIYTPVLVLPSICGLIGSTIPDWDGVIGLKHRGISHSLITPVILGTLACMISPSFGIVFACNYLLHLVLDSLTLKGIPLLAPFNWNYMGLKLIRSGGSEDLFICILIIYALSEVFVKM